MKRFALVDSGGALIELAIVIPVFLLLMIGVADFGRAYFTGITVANAARAGAQYGTLNVLNTQDTAGMRQAAEREAGDAGSIATVVAVYCKCPDGSSPACTGTTCAAPYSDVEIFVKVKVTKAVTMIMRYPGLPGTLTFRDSATFRAQ